MSMIRRAVKKGFSASYVLVDSWFFNSQLVQFVLDHNLHLVSRPKWNRWKYEYKEKSYTLGELIKKLQREMKYKTSRQLRRVSSDSYKLLIIRETSVIFSCFYARLFVCLVNNFAYGTLYFSIST